MTVIKWWRRAQLTLAHEQRHCEEPKATKQSKLALEFWIASLRSQGRSNLYADYPIGTAT
jgi:hypothetical protein